MTSSSASDRGNVLIPTAFLIGVTVLLVYFAIPRPYHDPIPTTPTPAPTAVVAAAESIEPTPEDHLTLMAFGLEEVPASSVQEGSRLFSVTCTACHGSDAKGILGLGKTLIDSEFVNRLNDDELVAFLHAGRATTDPLNTTGVAMPAKGGNPSLTDENLNAIVDYIRSLNGATVVNDVVGEPTPVPTLKPFQAINVNSIGSAETTSVPDAPETQSASATPNTTSVDATPTPVVSYGYDVQATATPTPVVSYGYDTQATTTEAPALPDESAPIPAYSYSTGPDTINVPPTYSYNTGPDTINVPPIYTYEAQGQS